MVFFRLSKRAVVLRLAIAIACVSGPTLTIVASGTRSMPTPITMSLVPRSATSRVGGSMTIRLRSAPDCLDPQKTASDASYTVVQAIVDTLVSMDDHGRIRPNLARSWDYRHGATWLTFHLYPDVRFSNGDPLDARAVAFTFARAVDPATRSPVSASLLDAVVRVRVLGPSMVRLILRAP